MKRLVIAIDGPSGAGKGTISRTLSEALGYRHIDTGAMYRAIGWKALHAGISLDDETAVTALAEQAAVVVEGGVVSIDGHDVTPRHSHTRDRQGRGLRRAVAARA